MKVNVFLKSTSEGNVQTGELHVYFASIFAILSFKWISSNKPFSRVSELTIN